LDLLIAALRFFPCNFFLATFSLQLFPCNFLLAMEQKVNYTPSRIDHDRPVTTDLPPLRHAGHVRSGTAVPVQLKPRATRWSTPDLSTIPA
jgi:hypothetical protein